MNKKVVFAIIVFINLSQQMKKKPSYNLEQNVTSTKNMKMAGSQDAPTHGKQFRDFEYSIYEQTNFQNHKNQYLIISEKIRDQRLMEHLGRYKSRDDKLKQINIFKTNFFKLKDLLILMTREADRYRSLLSSNGSTKQIKSTNVSCDYEVSFRKKIRKDLKDIETYWIQLFIEGSLKRLIPVLNLIRLPQDQIDFGFDMTHWHIETEFKFSSHHSSKSCCCG